MTFTLGAALQELADNKTVFSPNGIPIWHLTPDDSPKTRGRAALKCDDGWISYTPRSTGVKVKGNRRRKRGINS